jgi:predicted ABC-type ATPase
MLSISEMQGNEIVKTLFHGKKSVTNYFFIKYGPPGSGKGGIMSKALAHFGIHKDTLITIEIDHIIELVPGVEEEKEKIRNKQQSQEAIEKELSNLYWSTRKGGGDIISDVVLDEALLKKYNIAWETTGMTIAWTVREIKRIQKLGYNVVILYPIVLTEQLISRAQARQKTTGQISASAAEIKKGVDAAARNVKLLAPYVDRLMIYDNSGKKDEEHVVLEIINEYDWTPENNKPGPGWKQINWCDCKNVAEIRRKFDTNIVSLFSDCECENKKQS